MTAVIERLKLEPVLVVTFLQALIGVGLAFGLELTTEQRDAIIGLAVLLVAIGFGVRTQVTPVRKVQVEQQASELPPRDWSNV